MNQERNKQIKLVVKNALLQVLTEATEKVQPWGVLTGVRRTKLFHTLLLNGYTLEEVQEILTQEYRLFLKKCLY